VHVPASQTMPRDFLAPAFAGSKPTPLSKHENEPVVILFQTAPTRVACAWRATFVNDSWKMRKIAVDVPASISRDSCGVICRNEFRYDSQIPEPVIRERPRVPSHPVFLGRSSDAILRSEAIVLSTSCMAESTLARR